MAHFFGLFSLTVYRRLFGHQLSSGLEPRYLARNDIGWASCWCLQPSFSGLSRLYLSGPERAKVYDL